MVIMLLWPIRLLSDIVNGIERLDNRLFRPKSSPSEIFLEYHRRREKQIAEWLGNHPGIDFSISVFTLAIISLLIWLFLH